MVVLSVAWRVGESVESMVGMSVIESVDTKVFHAVVLMVVKKDS